MSDSTSTRRADSRDDSRRAASASRGLVYVSWAPHCSRSDHTARELGGQSFMVYAGWLGSHPVTILPKYLLQAFATLRVLRRERPDVVCVMTPPVFAALPAFAYAWWRRTRVVLDAHTCAFVLPRWQRLQWLQRWACRRAVTTFVTNEHLASRVRAWDAHATLVPDVPIVFDAIRPWPRDERFTVAVVCSFADDEPVDAIVAAARLLPDVRLHVTGDASVLPRRVRDALPDNLVLTGFLPTEAYAGLIVGADVVLDLTTHDHTMLRGAFEAIFQGVPVVVSDWPILREAFPIGAVHVANEPDAIAGGIRAVQAEHERLRAEARVLSAEKRRRWDVTRAGILALVRASEESPGTAASQTG
ncbi:glycosyltransferase [Luteitalea sp.]|jgi:glycosyltransferase involved in cell wall biosynthesis|uniref:glycosyltransferase family protein n=1 Tax=Luteitalea sp. TaxID=2004800 RepID=UPI0037C7E2A4